MDPITVGSLLTMALSGLVGNRADHFFCNKTRAIWAAFRDGKATPRNGDLTRAIRRSQLLALKLVVKFYEDLPHPDWREFPGYSAEDITTPLQSWIGRALCKDEPWRVDMDQQRAVEQRIERAFIDPEPLDRPAAWRVNELRTIALDLIVTEARQHAPNAKDWDRFAALLRDGGATGGGHCPGWWPLFRAFLAEEIKRDGRVRTILTEQGIAQILELETDIAAAVATLQAGFETTFADIKPALDELRDAAASAERLSAAVDRIDRDFTRIMPALVRIEAHIQRLPGLVRDSADDSNRAWHGIEPNNGQADLLPQEIIDRPARLLIARYRVVPFLDRDGLLERLIEWATGTEGPRAQGRLYVAPGGFGKTRLGIELLAALARLNWHGTFLSQMNAPSLSAGALRDLMRAPDSAGVCVVVDYAEGQISQLRALANAARAAGAIGPPIRIVAFARSAEGWWPGFAAEPGPDAVFNSRPFDAVQSQLLPDDRTALFERSRQAFADRLAAAGLSARTTGPVPDLSHADRPLLIVAAAYIDASGISRGDRSVFQTLYEEERQHWRRILRVESCDDPEVDDLARAAVQVTLVQGATEGGAAALIKADPTERILPGPKVLLALLHLYGRGPGGSGQSPDGGSDMAFIGPIEPDLLGEHTAMAVLDRHRGVLLEATLRTALAGPPLFAQDLGEILTVLTRATRPEHEPRIVRVAGDAIAGIAHLVADLAADGLERLGDALPRSSVALLSLATIIAGRLVDMAPDDSAEDRQAIRANRFNTLSVRLSDLGRRGEALAAGEEAVGLYRELAANNRDAFLPDLATALNNLGNRFSALGRRDEALTATEEAVRLYRELAAKNRDAFLPDLASALNNLGCTFSELGRRDEALAAGEEAVRLYRELAASNRDAFLSDLAMALNNLGNMFFALGRRDEALAAAEEAVRLRRELVADNRDAFLPNLAMALSNQGNRFSDLGRRGEALAAAEEAVRLYRELAANNPDAFLPGLARALGTYGFVLLAGERADLAAAAFEEGVEIVLPLAEAQPAAFGGLLGQLAQVLVTALRAAGRDDGIPALLARPGVASALETANQSPAQVEALRQWNALVEAVKAAAESGTPASAETAQRALDALVDFLAEHESDGTLTPVRDAVKQLMQALGQDDGTSPAAPDT
jgi:tetratricopeptide (TPR) repeat protein